MDEALQYLTEAQMHIDAFVEVSLADSFFEETDEIRNINKSNETHKVGALEALKKAFTALINKLKEAFNRITNFFKLQFMSKEEQEKYKEFLDMVKNDPELSKKQVTIEDFREYEKAYDDALKKLQEEANKPNPSVELANKVVETLSDKVKTIAGNAGDAAGRAALSVTLQTAVEIADRNTSCAKALNFAIKNEIVSLEAISKELGEAEAAKFEKKIERLSKAGTIHRIITGVLHRKEMTLQSIVKKQFNNLMSFTNLNSKDSGKPIVNAGSVLRGIAKNRKTIIDAAGGPAETAKIAKNMASTALKAKRYEKDAKRAVKQIKREGNELKSFLGVKK